MNIRIEQKEVELSFLKPGTFFVLSSEYEEGDYKNLWLIPNTLSLPKLGEEMKTGSGTGIICICIPSIASTFPMGDYTSFRPDLKVVKVNIKDIELEYAK